MMMTKIQELKERINEFEILFKKNHIKNPNKDFPYVSGELKILKEWLKDRQNIDKIIDDKIKYLGHSPNELSKALIFFLKELIKEIEGG